MTLVARPAEFMKVISVAGKSRVAGETTQAVGRYVWTFEILTLAANRANWEASRLATNSQNVAITTKDNIAYHTANILDTKRHAKKRVKITITLRRA